MNLKNSKIAVALVVAASAAFCPVLSAESRNVNDSPRPGLRAGYDSNQCSTLIEECLRTSDEAARSGCLYSTSQHLFCSGGTLGKLAEQRAVLVSSPSIGQGATNPRLIDNSCLEKFDNHLLARLIRGPVDKTTAEELSISLDSCVQKSAPELLQP